MPTKNPFPNTYLSELHKFTVGMVQVSRRIWQPPGKPVMARCLSRESRWRLLALVMATALFVGLELLPALALSPPGNPFTWGENFWGQLGNGTTTTSPVPMPVSGLNEVVAIDGGERHGVALKSDGTVMAWGNNCCGQLGNGTTTPRSLVPVPVSGLSGVKAIAAGGYHSLALASDGTVMAWGSNDYGELGNGTTTSRSLVPVPVSGLSGVKAIAAGIGHSLALKSDGTVVAWGHNLFGQLGNGTTTPRSLVPVPVSGLSGVKAIAAGTHHNLALSSDGTVMAWGDNFYGQLGNVTTTFFSNVPVPVSDLSGVRAIAGGGYHSLALKSDGTVMAWGSNNYGQLGDGTRAIRNMPVAVSGLSGVMDIAAGSLHSLALRSDGTVMAWGIWAYTSTTSSSVPVTVSGLSEVTAIAAGGVYSLAIRTRTTPTLTTQASPNVPVGGTIRDTATLAGGLSPTGTITFRVFGPGDMTCVTPLDSSTVAVSGNGTYTSAPFTTTAAGTYRWVASYSGDATNAPVGPTACDDPDEQVVVAAQVLTGRAYGAAATVVLPEGTSTVAPTPDTGAVSTSSAGRTSTPCATGSEIVAARTLCASVTTALGPSRSTASALALGPTIDTGIPGVPVIGATRVQAVSNSTCAASSGSATIAGLLVDGVPRSATSGPNTVIALSGPPGARLILNEQIPVPGGLTVNALHLIVPSSGGAGADVVVASATSDIHNCP